MGRGVHAETSEGKKLGFPLYAKKNILSGDRALLSPNDPRPIRWLRRRAGCPLAQWRRGQRCGPAPRGDPAPHARRWANATPWPRATPPCPAEHDVVATGVPAGKQAVTPGRLSRSQYRYPRAGGAHLAALRRAPAGQPGAVVGCAQRDHMEDAHRHPAPPASRPARPAAHAVPPPAVGKAGGSVRRVTASSSVTMCRQSSPAWPRLTAMTGLPCSASGAYPVAPQAPVCNMKPCTSSTPRRPPGWAGQADDDWDGQTGRASTHRGGRQRQGSCCQPKRISEAATPPLCTHHARHAESVQPLLPVQPIGQKPNCMASTRVQQQRHQRPSQRAIGDLHPTRSTPPSTPAETGR